VTTLDEAPSTPEPPAQGAPSHGGRKIAPWIAVGLAVVLLGLFVVLATAGRDDDNTADSHLLGRPAPEATGRLDDGTPFDLARRKGSWVVLNFFTADCVPCIQEHPELVEFAEQQQTLGSEGAEFYSVIVNDTEQDVDEFFAEYGGDWPKIYSERGEFPVAFGVSAVPETWIVDPNGIVRVRIISKVTADDLNVTLQQLRETT
jgi:cytochrome c biogenesis protein CcmG/thiol:disulfide interchange protein DsbE